MLLTVHKERDPLINCCPVCGEVLELSDRLNCMIHLTLCFDEGTGSQVMTGGFLTDKQASSGWMFKLSEWANFSTYEIGLRSGASASRILVYDRRKKRLVEEIIDRKIMLAMRAIYQSKFGVGLIGSGAKEILQSISEKQGRKMDSLESAKDITKFVEFFKDQINMNEVKYPLEHFKTFNEFFIRELKPGARPIARLEHDYIAVCAADCRLMAFNSVTDSSRFWIKGRKFSIQGLLGKEVCSDAFIDGSLVIFRLAPQVLLFPFTCIWNCQLLLRIIFFITILFNFCNHLYSNCRTITVTIHPSQELSKPSLIYLDVYTQYVKCFSFCANELYIFCIALSHPHLLPVFFPLGESYCCQ
nr:phosphatidylserine decarboxylase proenzyme 2-like isoform X2 [Ipomoea batatas]